MVKPVSGGVNLPYGAKPYSFAPTNPDGTSFGYAHHGVDLQASTGTSVKAPEGGKVLFSGLAGTAGNMVQIQGSTGVHRLLHNSQLLVSTGQTVSEGQEVAKSGYSGLVSPAGPAGAHVHWDLAVNGKYVNPVLYLGQEINMEEIQKLYTLLDQTNKRLETVTKNLDSLYKIVDQLQKNLENVQGGSLVGGKYVIEVKEKV